jgi:hypothetical protein
MRELSLSLWLTTLGITVRCPGLLDGELAALENRPGLWLKFTGLSGESSVPAPKVFSDELVALGNSPRTPWL